MPDPKAIEHEVDENYSAFLDQIDDLIRSNHRGKYALIRHKEIVEFFETAGDAVRYGQRQYGDHLFSVQEVTGKPLDLGYFSHGGPYKNV